jgi:seryl-tRNA synthetase
MYAPNKRPPLHVCLAAQQPDSPAQRRSQQLQAQLANTSTQLVDALDTQQQYADIIEQLKQGHAEFERQLDQLRAQRAGQQQLMTKVRRLILQHVPFFQSGRGNIHHTCTQKTTLL